MKRRPMDPINTPIADLRRAVRPQLRPLDVEVAGRGLVVAAIIIVALAVVLLLQLVRPFGD